MPQPNWNKLVSQGRAQAVGVPLSEGISFVPADATVIKELEPSPLTPEEKAFLESEEANQTEQSVSIVSGEANEPTEENLENAPENDVQTEQATEVGEWTENSATEQKPTDSDPKTEDSVTLPPENLENDPTNPENMTFNELKKALTDLGQTIPFGANKAKLVEMFNAIP